MEVKEVDFIWASFFLEEKKPILARRGAWPELGGI